MSAICGRTRLHRAPLRLPQAIRNSRERQGVLHEPAFPPALTAHGTFVRVTLGLISVRARRRALLGRGGSSCATP
ncbi:MAG: lasso RiPP family leader peptide-containing protein [Fretibacterium sp.]